MAVESSRKRTGNYVTKWNTEIIKNFINDNDIKVTLLSEYHDMYEKMDFKCECGEIFHTNWHEFNSKKFPKRQCNKCGRKKPHDINKITCTSIKEYLSKNNYPCELLSDDYIDCDSKLVFKCECGNTFSASWSSIKRMKGTCKDCSKPILSNEVFLHRVNEYFEDFEFLEAYKGESENIKIKCKKCNNIFYQSPKHIYERGVFCSCCGGSQGEQLIAKYLLKNNIEFRSQYVFKECKNIKPLPFDFYLPKENISIEFQGRQHYEPIQYFGGEDAYALQVKRDSIKKQYCEENNIKLIEIPYTKINDIEEILRDNILCKKVVM